MSKAKTPRQRTFSFGGTRVIVASEILNKWDKFPDKKIVFQDPADTAVMNRLVEKPWHRERDLYESIDLARDAIRRLFKTYRTQSDKRASGLEEDPVKLRDAAKVLKTAAKELCRRADAIEKPLSGYKPIPELQSILSHHWSCPDGICLCWMSYPALAKFLRLTVSSLESLTAAALEKQCWRLGLPKMKSPLVEEDQVYSVRNTVYIAGSS
jgi:hypothetical protein